MLADILRNDGHRFRPLTLYSDDIKALRKLIRSRDADGSDLQQVLDARGVTLLSAGIDEAPMVYKDIHQVMEAQEDLVESLAQFQPSLVKMAPAGERPED